MGIIPIHTPQGPWQSRVGVPSRGSRYEQDACAPSWVLLTIDDTKATKTDRKAQGPCVQGERRVRRCGIFAAKIGPMLGFVMVMTARSGSDKR